MHDKITACSKQLFENGFVQIKGLLNKEELELLIAAIDSDIKKPSPFARIMDAEQKGKFFMDFNSWKRLPLINQMCRLPKLLDLVTSLTGSKKCWLFHDHVLVKDQEAPATPIHQDRPYYIFKGDLNLSVWMTPDFVAADSGMIFYKGTHKIDKLYMPRSFRSGNNIEINKDGFEVITEETVKPHEAVSADMEPGDAWVFFNNTIHAAHPHISKQQRRALSVRYLLDGATMTKKYVNATPPFDRMGVKVEEDAPVPEKFFPLLRG